MSIIWSVVDYIVEGVDQNQDGGDEETKSGRIGGGRNEETDPGDDDEQQGGKVVGQDVHLREPSEFELESNCRIGCFRRVNFISKR